MLSHHGASYKSAVTEFVTVEGWPSCSGVFLIFGVFEFSFTNGNIVEIYEKKNTLRGVWFPNRVKQCAPNGRSVN